MRLTNKILVCLALFHINACGKSNQNLGGDSGLTSISVHRPDAALFPSGAPIDKIESIAVNLAPDWPMNGICTEQKPSLQKLKYTC